MKRKDTNVSPPKPPWLRKRLPAGADFQKVQHRLEKGQLHTVCQEAHCPNIHECFSHHTATFLILGETCTRNCRFCAISSGPLSPPDPNEPKRVAKTALEMGLTYIVVTSVTRDDLPDGGAGHFADTIYQIKKKIPHAQIEVLIPDFKGDVKALYKVLDAGPSVLNHNIETAPRLYQTVRPEAIYTRSLELLNHAATYRKDIPTKSGLMLGIGETDREIQQTLTALRSVNCQFLTLGQYLQPSKEHLPVDRYVTPDEFINWADVAKGMGFTRVASGPLVRSSYHAKELFLE
jgi:lipoyl synthase